MSLKFRLKGLAETFVEDIYCPHCGNDGGDGGDEDFNTDLSRVTFDGIIVVVQCCCCGEIFVPDGQRLGVINQNKLRDAVEKDSVSTGQPIYPSRESVKLDVERMKAQKDGSLH